jgi:4'-phosphopantetheinyl transferase
VWRADLSTVSGDLGELLSAQERARAERFLSEPAGELWRRSRGVLRALLGLYLQTDPLELRFATAEHGKPELLGGALSFNLSHSAQLALYAFTEAGAVGVDVEVARRPIDEVALAAQMFGPAEAERLRELDPHQRSHQFLRAWTRNEAVVKCRGTGIGRASASTVEPWIAELHVGSGAAAAVALERPARELRRWTWPPGAAVAGC